MIQRAEYFETLKDLKNKNVTKMLTGVRYTCYLSERKYVEKQSNKHRYQIVT